ncbi:MAG: DUF3501 family protein [Acidimicrobiales bacterium]
MSRQAVSQPLQLADIADLRAYEREREDFRDHIIQLKKRRRCGVGPVVTLLFENRETVRFQIQEMARAERIISDEGIQAELDVYNPLVPARGQLCATLFLELTTEDQLRDWLPKLVGIERSVVFQLGDGTHVRCTPDAQHESQLTRDATTAAVHYVTWHFTEQQIETFGDQDVSVAIVHEHYQYGHVLTSDTRKELLGDLLGEVP